MSKVSRLEVIQTGARRRWTPEEKRRIVAESASAPRLVSATARRYGLSAGQLFTWRRLVREGRLGAEAEAVSFAQTSPMLDIKRREFIALVGGGLLLAAKVKRAGAQQPAMPVIGFLNSQSPGVYPPMAAAFHQGLEEIGFVDGQNVAIEYRWAQGRSDRLRALAAELVRRQVALIVAAGSSSALAAKAETTTFIAVFFLSLNRPFRDAHHSGRSHGPAYRSPSDGLLQPS
jgi:transposase-like protein